MAVENVAKAPAADILHDDVAASVFLEGVVNGRDVRMGQRRSGSRLIDELLTASVIREWFSKLLEGDDAPEKRVLGTVDGRHTTTADYFMDAVATGKQRRMLSAQVVWFGYHGLLHGPLLQSGSLGDLTVEGRYAL